MKYETEVMDVMKKLVIARDADVGEFLAARGYYSQEKNSDRNNARKILKYLTGGGQLEEGGGGAWFRIHGETRSNFCEHSQHLTKAIVKILKSFPDSQVIREKEIPAVKLVPDAIIALADGNRRQVCILEAVNNEFENFTRQKVDIWFSWDGALKHLSNLFGYRIPHFEIVAYPESPIKEVWNFQDFMEEAER